MNKAHTSGLCFHAANLTYLSSNGWRFLNATTDLMGTTSDSYTGTSYKILPLRIFTIKLATTSWSLFLQLQIKPSTVQKVKFARPVAIPQSPLCIKRQGFNRSLWSFRYSRTCYAEVITSCHLEVTNQYARGFSPCKRPQLELTPSCVNSQENFQLKFLINYSQSSHINNS